MFWTLTPREYAGHMAGAAKRIERERDERLWLAWHVAALHAAAMSKNGLPSLDELRGRPEPARRQTPEEIEAVRIAFETQMGLRP